MCQILNNIHFLQSTLLNASDHRKIGALYLQYIFEAVSVHFKSYGSAPYDVLPSTPYMLAWIFVTVA